jgi:hypothetical protein
VLPAGQFTRDVPTESDSVGWMRPSTATAAVDDGSMLMLPPTYATLGELSLLDGPQQALEAAAAREIRTVEPTLRFDDAGAYLSVE